MACCSIELKVLSLTDLYVTVLSWLQQSVVLQGSCGPVLCGAWLTLSNNELACHIVFTRANENVYARPQ